MWAFPNRLSSILPNACYTAKISKGETVIGAARLFYEYAGRSGVEGAARRFNNLSSNNLEDKLQIVLEPYERVIGRN